MSATDQEHGSRTEPENEVGNISSAGSGIIVAGWLRVDRHQRDSYLAGCVTVIEAARAFPGCHDFHLSADPLKDDRINVYEHWASRPALEAFRGSGPSDDQNALIRSAQVSEHRICPP